MKDQKYGRDKDIKYRAYIFAIKIIKFIQLLEKRDFSIEVMTKQLLRSATSIGANIIEAKAASSKKDFINFYHYALKSANETKFWLGLLRDSKITKYEGKLSELLNEATEILNILGKCILTLKNK